MDFLNEAVREKRQQEQLIRGSRAGFRSVSSLDPDRTVRGRAMKTVHLTTHDGVGNYSETPLWGVGTWGDIGDE